MNYAMWGDIGRWQSHSADFKFIFRFSKFSPNISLSLSFFRFFAYARQIRTGCQSTYDVNAIEIILKRIAHWRHTWHTHTQNGKRNDLNCCVWVRRKMICSNRMEMDGICPMITQLLELSHWRCTFYSQSAFTCFQIDLFSQHICIPWIKQTFVPVKYFRHSIDGFGIRSHFERTLEIVFVLLQLQCVIQFSQKPLRMSF